jgi:hypothetical protein
MSGIVHTKILLTLNFKWNNARNSGVKEKRNICLDDCSGSDRIKLKAAKKYPRIL